ncbi:hypothetical protein FF38_13862 [Lucilia cuprina]|uniref:Uncharacterized protein n=1 Tax=Lucilia cuprina TaxID=7375 RepID=A0A0L0CT14_LUCCU|nr:hypothetical protein FF38_13862 [Lucilia cuprina]
MPVRRWIGYFEHVGFRHRQCQSISRGVIANLKEKNNNIVLVPCVCLSIQLSVSSASKTLPEEIEYLVAETYNWFSKSTIRLKN